MRRKPRRSVPVTAKTKAAPFKQTQVLISKYHTLNKRLAMATTSKDTEACQTIEKELEQMGGLAAYQRASLRGGNLSKGWGASGTWVITFLKAHHAELHHGKNHNNQLLVLDIGAITGEVYVKYPFLHVESIDLNSQSPQVQKQDFFLRPIPECAIGTFDVLCLSLVVNFVGDPVKRGDMLAYCRHFIKPNGLLYIVLPLPCITNSRYLNHTHFIDILKILEFELVKHHHSKKLAYYIFRYMPAGRTTFEQVSKKIIADGKARNNFAIALRHSPQLA